MALSAFTLLYSYHPCLVPEQSITPEEHLSSSAVTPHPSTSTAPDNQEPTLCACGSAWRSTLPIFCSGHFPSTESHAVWPFVFGFSHRVSYSFFF